MQPIRIVPRFVHDLAPLTGNRNVIKFDRIALGRGVHDILAVDGTPTSPPNEEGLSVVTWRGAMSDLYLEYGLRNGWLVWNRALFNIPDESAGEATHDSLFDIRFDAMTASRKPSKGETNDGRILFTGTVIAGAHPNEDDLFPGRLFHELGYPRQCVSLRFENGRIVSKEPCLPLIAYLTRQKHVPVDAPYDDEERMAAMLTLKLPSEWPYSCDCPMPTFGAEAIGGGALDLLLSMMLRIQRNRERDVHPFRLLARLVRGLREGTTNPVALDPWTPWHQRLNEAYHKCSCLPDLEKALRVEPKTDYKDVGSCPVWRS
jgi:hypothetical protein